MATIDTQVRRRRRPHRLQRVVNTAIRAISDLPVLGRLQDRSVCQLRFAGRRTGRRVSLPVMYARDGDRLVVLVGGPAGKMWWRNFVHPHPVEVLLRRRWYRGLGQVVGVGAPGKAAALRVYRTRFPEVPLADDDLTIVIDLVPADRGGAP